MLTIDSGHYVAVHYTGTFDSGEEFDSSRNREPLAFIVGQGHVIPGFEKAVVGLKIGEKSSFTVAPKDGYGEYDDDQVMKVPSNELTDVSPEVGMCLQLQLTGGHQVVATITEVKDGEVTLDLNHPLAGRTLHFQIEITDIKVGADIPEMCSSHGCESCGGSCGEE